MITGFGIRKPDQVRRFKEYTDGIVVGSFLIESFYLQILLEKSAIQ